MSVALLLLCFPLHDAKTGKAVLVYGYTVDIHGGTTYVDLQRIDGRAFRVPLNRLAEAMEIREATRREPLARKELTQQQRYMLTMQARMRRAKSSARDAAMRSNAAAGRMQYNLRSAAQLGSKRAQRILRRRD